MYWIFSMYRVIVKYFYDIRNVLCIKELCDLKKYVMQGNTHGCSRIIKLETIFN